MNQHQEAGSRTPCKYTASPATSPIYTELIYLLPEKETTIILFTLCAAASPSPSSPPPSAPAKDSVKDELPFHPGQLPPPGLSLSGLTDHNLLSQITTPGHQTRRPAVHVRPLHVHGKMGNGFHGRERLPRKSSEADKQRGLLYGPVG